jgi:uncharacterized protein with HEPN domain
MNKRDETRLRDMLDAAQHARSFVQGKTRRNLDADIVLSFAVVRALEIIGEAASRVTAETRSALTGIPWKAMFGMRNRIIHDYDQVDYDIVWLTITDDIPSLIAELERILIIEE